MKILSLIIVTLSLHSAFAGFRQLPEEKRTSINDRNQAAILYNFRNGTYAPFFDWGHNIQSMDLDNIVIKRSLPLGKMFGSDDRERYTVYVAANVLKGNPTAIAPMQFKCGVTVFNSGTEEHMQVNLTIEHCDVYALDSSGRAKEVLLKDEVVFMGWGKLPPSKNNFVAD